MTFQRHLERDLIKMRFNSYVVVTWLFVGWCNTVMGQDYYYSSEAEGPSERLLNHALMLNGFYIAGNPGDSENPSALVDLEFFSLRPVDIPVLKPGITFYFEYQKVGTVQDQKVFRLTETEDGLIKSELFDFADPSKFVPGAFEIDDLTALQESDIGTYRCTLLQREMRNGNFKEVSRSPTCDGYNQVRIRLNCRAIIAMFQTGQKVRQIRYGDRYPLSSDLEEKTRNFNFRCRN